MTSTLTPQVSPADHAQGPSDAPVTLLEYGDYECPYCGEAYPIVQKVQQQMGDRLRFVFRNFPLSEMHPNALAAADFAESAAAQNAFWPAHDWLFTHQDRLGEGSLRHAADTLHLDAQAMERNEDRARQRVEADLKSGERSGVQGTPTFFINGVLFQDSWDFPTLLAAVRDAGQTGG